MTVVARSVAIRDELHGSFGGELVTRGDPPYDQLRRVWNGSIDRSPALIARCRSVADVVAAIRFARATGLPVAVRGGGHSYPGHSVCEDGIVIDLGLMKGIRVDPEAGTARVQAGVLWGLRGGGGNFGIVTEFEFRLHPVGSAVLAGPMYWPIEKAPALLRFYRDWIAEAPDELMTIVMQRRAPAVDFVPAHLHGELIVAVTCCYAGAIEDGEAVLRPLRGFGSPVLDLCRPSRTWPTRRCSTPPTRTAGTTTSARATSPGSATTRST